MARLRKAVKAIILRTLYLILASGMFLLHLGHRRRWQVNRATGTGPASWREAMALRFIIHTFSQPNRSGRMERFLREFYPWLMRRFTLENRNWSCTLSDDQSRFIWKVQMPVLYGAIELPDGRRIELLAPLKGATDSDLRMFQFQGNGLA